MNGSKWLRIIMFLLIAASSAYGSEKQNPQNFIGYWDTTYEKADPKSDPYVEKAYRIFDRVASVADKRGTRIPHLRVIKSKGDPWAISLPDGYIVLSQNAVDMCYHNVSEEEGNARLAFVIGHELGHAADDDFWHLDTFIALSDKPQLRNILKNSNEVENIRAKEMKADDRGFMYSAIAGYSVDLLLGDSKGKKDFFTQWLSQIPHKCDENKNLSECDKHPKPEERAQFLQNRLKTLLDKVDFFKFGVRLTHFQRYSDALYFFAEFQKVFPSREVFNNMGYCSLQLAVREIPSSFAYEYWLPMITDIRTRADSLTLKGGGTKEDRLSESASQFLREAESYLKKACESDKNYVPSRLNLATTYFYLGEMYKARSIIEEARELEPQNPEVITLRALIIYREDPNADLWPQTVKILEELSEKPNPPLFVRYNLAVLLEKRGRTGNALDIWKSLAEQAQKIPVLYRPEVFRKAQISEPYAAIAKQSKLPWNIPVHIGADLFDKEVKSNLDGWQKTEFDWQHKKLAGHIYRNTDKTTVLEMDNFVEMFVIPAPKNLSTDALNSFCTGTLYENSLSGGTLYSCDASSPQWMALVQEGMVSEIWIAKH